MTLTPYDEDQLNALFLRTYDISSRLRHLMEAARTSEVDHVLLNDKKALEWLTKLEGWTTKTEAQVRLQIVRQLGERAGATDA